MSLEQKRFYNLAMFSYPSGNKLHLGHWYNYAPADTYSRFKKLQGFDVFQPMGFDSFGLPAENHAIKTGVSPAISVRQNMDKMREQLVSMGGFYDWDAYLETSDPSYYKLTQWLFCKLFNDDLAYKKKSPVNYCTQCATVLANEQCKDDKCDRCGQKIIQKELDQWFLRITNYKDRLLSGLDDLDWPEKTKTLQRHWLNNLQDWCISRQRYWGTPIPIVYSPDGKPTLIKIGLKSDAWELPTDVDFKLSDPISLAAAPLSRSKELRERVTKRFGEGWTPEFDTMDTFVDSSFYFIEYLRKAGKDLREWLPVDLCIGGIEHADKHLIFARFITMFLFDINVSPVEEPFKKVIHQGIIKVSGEKMSKSKGNAVDPDVYVDKYGSDVLRLHLMFMGPYDQGGEWNDKSMVGMKRFLDAVKRKLSLPYVDKVVPPVEMDKLLTNVTKYLENLKFNLAIASFMKFIKATGSDFLQTPDKLKFIIALAPLAPKTATTLWSQTTTLGELWCQTWPDFETQKDDRDFLIQVDGKVKGRIKLAGDETNWQIGEICASHIKIKFWNRRIIIPGKIINFITAGIPIHERSYLNENMTFKIKVNGVFRSEINLNVQGWNGGHKDKEDWQIANVCAKSIGLIGWHSQEIVPGKSIDFKTK